MNKKIGTISKEEIVEKIMQSIENTPDELIENGFFLDSTSFSGLTDEQNDKELQRMNDLVYKIKQEFKRKNQ